MSGAMGMQAVSCGLIGAGLALIPPERPRHPLLRGLIAGLLGCVVSIAVSAVAS